jgi:general secretion pathway protein G
VWHGEAKLNRPDRRQSNASGFTVVELLAVMVIITLLVAMVIGVVRYADHAAQDSVAKADLERLHLAVNAYELEEGDVPDTETFYSESFRGRLHPPLELEDPWGGKYAYSNLSSRGYALVCLGPDGLAGTPDDIYPGE